MDRYSTFTTLPKDLHPQLARFLDYWLDRRGDKAMPGRTDIDPMDIPDLLPGICLLEAGNLASPTCKIRFRLAGTRLREMVGYDVTGRCIDEVFDPVTAEKMIATYQWIADRLEPHYEERQKAISATTTAVYERILAPLGDNNRPTMFFGMHVVKMQGHMPLDGDIPVG